MGEVIDLTIRRAASARRSDDIGPMFFFDVSDPLSYLTAERVERSLGTVEWIAVDGGALADSALRSDRAGRAELRRRAEARAHALRLPLVWPETFPKPTPCAQRVASYACEIGVGSKFALAASRLAFCGGFDLEDPEALTEAAAAAGIPLESCLEAAGEQWRDEELTETATVLRDHSISRLPAVTVGGRWFSGDGALLGAAAAAAEQPRPARIARVAARSARPRAARPLAPVC